MAICGLSLHLGIRAIKDYWRVKTESVNSNPKQFYSIFKPFLDSKSSTVDNTRIILEMEGNMIKDQTEVANHFAEHFAKVANDIGDSRMLSLSEEDLNDHPSVKDIENRKRVVNGPTFEFHMFSETEVAKSLANLNPSKTAGHDRISPRILRTASTEQKLSSKSYRP